MRWSGVLLEAMLCAGLFLGGSRPLAADGLDLVQAMVQAVPGEPGSLVSNQEILVGQGRIRIESALMVPVRRGAVQVGLYFEGRGELKYGSREPLEFAVMRTNLAWNTKVRAIMEENVPVVTIPFRRLFLASFNVKLPAPGTGAVLDNPGEFGELRTYFRTSDLPPLEQAFAFAKGNDDGRPWVMAELEGEAGCWQYAFDPYLAEAESLHVVPRPRKTWMAPEGVVVSSQPLGWSYRQPKMEPVILTDVGIDLLTHDNENVQLQVQETYRVQRPGTRILALDLLSFFQKANLNAPDVRPLKLTSVKDGAGKALPFSHLNHRLLVELPEALASGSIVKLAFAIEGDFLIHPRGDNSWKLGTGPWFPQPRLGGDLYTVRCRMKVKKPFLPIASGENSVRRVEGDYNLLETSFDRPICFFVALAGSYAMTEETRDGITLRVASYDTAGSSVPRILSLARTAIQFYQSFLGPFPFKEYTIVQVNSYGYGQAPPHLMFLTNEAFDIEHSLLRDWSSQDLNRRFLHEIAHAYWGNAVHFPSETEQWLSEGFAEICAGLFMNATRGEGAYATMVARWKSDGKESSRFSSIPMANRLYDKDFLVSWRTRQHLLYDKSAALLSTIREQIGDPQFRLFLRAYQRNFAWKQGSTHHVVGMLGFLTKRDFAPLFDACFWGEALPGKD